MTFQRLATGYAALGGVLACVLPATYLVTRDRAVVERLPFPALCVVLLLEFPLIPVGLIVGLGLLRMRGLRWSLFGAAVGLALGAWLTTVALGIPYCGLYPNLPALFLLMLIRGLKEAPDPGLTFTAVYVVNLVVYPLIGWLVGAAYSLATDAVSRSLDRPVDDTPCGRVDQEPTPAGPS